MERIGGRVPDRGHEDRTRGQRPGARAAGPRLDRPVFIVAPPRSGASAMVAALAGSADAWTLPRASSGHIESVVGLGPAAHGWESNQLTRADAYSDVVQALSTRLAAAAVDRNGRSAAPEQRVRLLHWSPKNALRVPFLAKAFPAARFVYVYRDPAEALERIVDGWRSGRYVTYPELPGWDGPPWSFLLTPGWRELPHDDLAAVAADQWRRSVDQLLDDLAAIPGDRWCVASHDRVVDPASAAAEVQRVCSFCELDADFPFEAVGRTSTVEPAEPVDPADIARVLPVVAAAADRARDMFARPPTIPSSSSAPPKQPEHAFSSLSTTNLAPLLRRLGVTPILTTYQSGRLIAVRAEGNSVNTHFRMFPSPMGVAIRRGRLALGTKRSVWEFRNVPAVAAKIPPAGSHDACFLPAQCHVTGDIDIHEMAYIGEELWVVNTRFSCLATLDRDHSFRPRWRPPFVSGLAPQDRCHLNGMAVVDDEVRFVTALGVSDEAGGWRENKAHGGVIVDVRSGEIVTHGLSMPHSPRWHDGRLWVLESGEGRLCTVDAVNGGRETVAEVPGFARGLAFAGHLAFIGLSQVRERLFGGIPISVRLDESERACGLWVVDTRSGATVAFLRFEGAVQEVFDVQLLHGIRFPELVEPEADLTGSSYVLPDEALADVQH
ncbi:MAG: TIGR03032 family protein [Actinomycetota bacterium]|nr:TIGR03032 family protein [Actinomycetota bacterium]